MNHPPISRYLFNIDINQEEVIYLMIDEYIIDYYTFMKQFINQGDTKSDILFKKLMQIIFKLICNIKGIKL